MGTGTPIRGRRLSLEAEQLAQAALVEAAHLVAPDDDSRARRLRLAVSRTLGARRALGVDLLELDVVRRKKLRALRQ